MKVFTEQNGYSAAVLIKYIPHYLFMNTYAKEYHLIPYNGKLKNNFNGKATSMFIIFKQSEKEVKIPVSVDETHYMIFITKDTFTKYGKIFSSIGPLQIIKNY